MDLRFSDAQSALKQRLVGLDSRLADTLEAIEGGPYAADEFHKMYDVTWIYHENGLEGVVLGYPEIRSAVDNKIISDVSLLPAYRDIKAQKRCIDSIRAKAENRRGVVSLRLVKDLHRALVHHSEVAGEYRQDIPIHRTYFHEIAIPGDIDERLNAVLTDLRAKREKGVHPLEFAAAVHHRFMRVFPFSRFSGFFGRLVLNFVLLRHGYLPVVIHATDRQRYYECLRGSERDFANFLCEVVENSLNNTLRFFSDLAEPQRRRRA